MKQHQKAYGILITTLLFLLAGVPVSAQPDSAGEGDSSPAVEEVAEAGANQGEEAREVTGLDLVLDGGSLESFEKGLEEIKETSTSNEYLMLEKSIQYLLFYDLTANRDMEKLAERLDGLTGRQIMEKVSKRRG